MKSDSIGKIGPQIARSSKREPECKGHCWGGIVYMPQHPDADVNGLLRGIMRSRDLAEVQRRLQQYGLKICLITWRLSNSISEQQASSRNYGALLTCPLDRMYLSAESYAPLARAFLLSEQRKTGRQKIEFPSPQELERRGL